MVIKLPVATATLRWTNISYRITQIGKDQIWSISDEYIERFIYIFISPIMVAINIKKSRTQTHAHEHTRYTNIRNYMPTVHVVKQYMIDSLTQTLDIQSKQHCLTKPFSVKIFFSFFYHIWYILATKHKRTLLGCFRRWNVKDFLKTTNYTRTILDILMRFICQLLEPLLDNDL